MRPIDADKLLEQFCKKNIQMTFNLPVEEVLEEDTDIEDFSILVQDAIQAYKKMVIDTINSQPTAYDMDKVVEQLEERTSFLKDCSKYGNQSEEQERKSYETMMMYEITDLVEDLIDIVKSGGIEE